ncbi:hypothetical protein CC78DRAFT_112815 [Lojkania enalia]|uniref:Uncharacterized protein n=1 Tax=Lojkania enalia TaxID=147567 RepID=A0A9P4JXS5_9PLEO|nr:hypothetical protein CC78DRAFT_112815 [Didymosphaeria enalia]
MRPYPLPSSISRTQNHEAMQANNVTLSLRPHSKIISIPLIKEGIDGTMSTSWCDNVDVPMTTRWREGLVYIFLFTNPSTCLLNTCIVIATVEKGSRNRKP